MARRKTNRQINTVSVVIGDGKTESLYIESIKAAFADRLKNHSLKPELPAHSRVEDLEHLIEKYLDRDMVLCVIDMDTKLQDAGEMAAYKKLKAKYKGSGKVHFFETHPCTELWFYYHFKYTTAPFSLYNPDLKKLLCSKIPGYEKKAPFCTHKHICKQTGDLELAISNARKSVKSRDKDGREYTYSEMAELFEKIGLVEKEPAEN